MAAGRWVPGTQAEGQGSVARAPGTGSGAPGAGARRAGRASRGPCGRTRGASRQPPAAGAPALGLRTHRAPAAGPCETPGLRASLRKETPPKGPWRRRRRDQHPPPAAPGRRTRQRPNTGSFRCVLYSWGSGKSGGPGAAPLPATERELRDSGTPRSSHQPQSEGRCGRPRNFAVSFNSKLLPVRRLVLRRRLSGVTCRSPQTGAEVQGHGGGRGRVSPDPPHAPVTLYSTDSSRRGNGQAREDRP